MAAQANAIRINSQVVVQNPPVGSVGVGQAPYSYPGTARQQSLTQQNPGGIGAQQAIPTTAAGTALVTTGVVTFGILEITNLDVTNYVSWGPDNAGTILKCGRILPGETQIFRLEPGITFKLLANMAPVDVQYQLNEN